MIVPIRVVERRFRAALLGHSELIVGQFLFQLRCIRFLEIFHRFWLRGRTNCRLWAFVADLCSNRRRQQYDRRRHSCNFSQLHLF